MKEPTLAEMTASVRRLERQVRVQNRILVVLLCAALAAGSIAVSNAQPTVITAQEVRAQRFTLLGPNGDVFDYWYSTPTQVIKP